MNKKAIIHKAVDCIESLLFGLPSSEDDYEFRSKEEIREFLKELHEFEVVELSESTLKQLTQ